MQLPPDFWTTRRPGEVEGIFVGGVIGVALFFYFFLGAAKRSFRVSRSVMWPGITTAIMALTGSLLGMIIGGVIALELGIGR